MKNFYATLFFLSLLFVSSNNASAKEYKPSGYFFTEFLEKYHLPNGAIGYDDPVVQSTLYFNLPKNFYGSVFWSTGINNKFSHDFDDEINYNLGRSGKIGKFNFNIGFLYSDIYNLGSSSGPIGDIAEPYGDISRDFLIGTHRVTPYLRLEGFIPIRSRSKFGNGMNAHLGITHYWKISKRVRLRHSPEFLFDTGAVGFDRAVIVRYNIGLEIKITKKFLIVPKISASSPIGHVLNGTNPIGDGRKKERFIPGIRLVYIF